MILARNVSSLYLKSIKILVKGSTFDVNVRPISSLMSFSLIGEQEFLFKFKNKKDDVFSLVVYWQM